jgi:hypothetical protein
MRDTESTPPSTRPTSIADIIERYGRMLTVKELVALVAESPKTIYARVKRGVQPATLIGASIHFDLIQTAAWLRSQST